MPYEKKPTILYVYDNNKIINIIYHGNKRKRICKIYKEKKDWK